MMKLLSLSPAWVERSVIAFFRSAVVCSLNWVMRIKPTSSPSRRERRFGNGRLSSVHHCDGLARYHELPQVNGYPFHPSEQDMISAAGINDQELTIIVSMMLIKFAPVVAGISISRLISSALRCLARSG